MTQQPPREDVWVPSVCQMCYNTCSIQVHREDGVLTKVTGIADAPPNHGKICAKGNAQIQSAYSPYRILRPMIRTNPKKGLNEDPGWKEISWEEGLTLAAERLKKVREDDPRKLMLLSFDVPAFLILRAFASGYGTMNYSTGAAGYFCGNAVHPVTFSFTGALDMMLDLEHSDYIIEFGSQFGFVAQSHAMVAAEEMAVARERGMKLVVVDPVLSQAASKADEWVPIRPGTDAAFALGMANVLLNDVGIYDAEFLRKYSNATYLVGPDGHYVRDAATDKPLVWNLRLAQAETFDVCSAADVALEGSFTAQGVACRPSFVLLKEHLRQYTPEKVQEITTVPAETVRRVAIEFGKAAKIGSTIVIDGVELPHRPAAVWWYRGVSQHKHGTHNGFACGILNALVGAVDVPGGFLNANGAGPFGFPSAGPDGFIVKGNPYSHMRSPWPPQPVKAPESLELIELFPVSTYARAVPWLSILEPETFKVPYMPEILIQCRANLMSTTADPERTAEALAKVPFQISFADFFNETVWLADLVFPDTHSLERLLPFAADPFHTHYAPPPPGGDWWFAIQQPVKPPAGESRFWIEVLFELADRGGFLPDTYASFNALGRFQAPYLLDMDKKYTWEEISDRWLRSRCGPEHGVEYFKKHGYLKIGKRTVQESYPRPFHNGRMPIYLEHFQRAGEQVAKVTQELGIPWETDDYQALIEWKPCPSYHRKDGSLWVINTKVPFYTHSITAENPLLNELGEMNTHLFTIGINAETARQRGIAQGDRIRLDTDWGRSVEGFADLRQGVHPEVLVCPGITGRTITGDPRVRGKGIHYNSLIKYTADMMDYTSAALDACVRVQVVKI